MTGKPEASVGASHLLTPSCYHVGNVLCYLYGEQSVNIFDISCPVLISESQIS